MRMRSVYYSVGEEIVREGEWADEIFFIVSGAVEVVIPVRQVNNKFAGAAGAAVEKRVALLVDNQFFGERAVLQSRERRGATCRALMFTEMRTLHRKAFLEAATKFPAILKQVVSVNASREKDTQKKREETPEQEAERRRSSRDLVVAEAAADDRPAARASRGSRDEDAAVPVAAAPAAADVESAQGAGDGDDAAAGASRDGDASPGCVPPPAATANGGTSAGDGGAVVAGDDGALRERLDALGAAQQRTARDVALALKRLDEQTALLTMLAARLGAGSDDAAGVRS